MDRMKRRFDRINPSMPSAQDNRQQTVCNRCIDKAIWEYLPHLSRLPHTQT